jgi:L-fuconate dehydratase
MLFRIGPEKGVIHIATGAVGNAIWDMYARSRSKPLWKLVVDMTPVRSARSYPVRETALTGSVL